MFLKSGSIVFKRVVVKNGCSIILKSFFFLNNIMFPLASACGQNRDCEENAGLGPKDLTKLFALFEPNNTRVFFFLRESKNGFVISDHSDHGASKELTNPCPEWIHRFL